MMRRNAIFTIIRNISPSFVGNNLSAVSSCLEDDISYFVDAWSNLDKWLVGIIDWEIGNGIHRRNAVGRVSGVVTFRVEVGFVVADEPGREDCALETVKSIIEFVHFWRIIGRAKEIPEIVFEELHGIIACCVGSLRWG